MMAQPTIAILTPSSDRFLERRSLLALLLPRWRAQGWRVEVVTERGPAVAADLALLHVSQSVVPEDMRRLMRHYPSVLNGSVLDIRKRTFSRLLVAREGPAAPGPVIVKSNWNFGGFMEFGLEAARSWEGRILGGLVGRRRAIRLLTAVDARRSWARRRTLRPYAVFANREAVPAGVWANPHLVVERFAAERRGDLYCCRHWLFFGGAEVSRLTLSTSPVVKLAAGRPVQLTEPVPPRLRELRAQLGFDYGKFDYGVVDGEVVLYDTNRTPGASPDPGVHDQTVEVLAQGLAGVLGGSGAFDIAPARRTASAQG